MQKLRDTLVFRHDEFQGVTFVTHPKETQAHRRVESFCSARRCSVSLMPYIGYGNSSKWMFVRVFYMHTKWLFMDQIYVVVDGQRFQSAKYRSYSDRVTRRTTGTNVWETIDFDRADKGIDDIVHAIAVAPTNASVRVRFAGDAGNLDFELGEEDLIAFKDMLFFYDNFDPRSE